MQRLVRCVQCSIDFQLGVCERLNYKFFKSVVLVFLAVRICRAIVLWATHSLLLRASVYRGCPCWDPPMCPDAQVGIRAERQPFVVVGVWSFHCLVRTLPNKFNVISPFASSGVTALLLYVFRVPCLTTILDSWSLECENTYTIGTDFHTRFPQSAFTRSGP